MPVIVSKKMPHLLRHVVPLKVSLMAINDNDT